MQTFIPDWNHDHWLFHAWRKESYKAQLMVSKTRKPWSKRMDDITHRTGMTSEMTVTYHHRTHKEQNDHKNHTKTCKQRVWILSLNEKLLQNWRKFSVYQINSVKYIDCSHKCAARISKIGMIAVRRNCWNTTFIRRTILYRVQMGHTINIKHWNAVFQQNSQSLKRKYQRKKMKSNYQNSLKLQSHNIC